RIERLGPVPLFERVAEGDSVVGEEREHADRRSDDREDGGAYATGGHERDEHRGRLAYHGAETERGTRHEFPPQRNRSREEDEPERERDGEMDAGVLPERLRRDGAHARAKEVQKHEHERPAFASETAHDRPEQQ